jgi:hypothetical protein
MLSGTYSGEYDGSLASLYNLWLGVSYVQGGGDVNTALSGPKILADGISNVTLDASFELNFAEGSALNREGTDLVLFDAEFYCLGPNGISYCVGSYGISVDGFKTELILTGGESINEIAGDFISTGESRTYMLKSWAPYTTTIFGAPIDLSLLGVPDGISVSQIQVRSASSYDNDADFIGVGSLTAIPEPASVLLLTLGLFLLRKRILSAGNKL